MYQPGQQSTFNYNAPPSFGTPGSTLHHTGGYSPQPGGWTPSQSGEDKYDKKHSKDPLLSVIRWIKARNPKEKMYLGIAAGLLSIIILYFIIEDHDTLFVLSETVHLVGIAVLAYKLVKKKNTGGLSLKTQELTAGFLAVRLFCSFMMEYDVHTMLDLLTLFATGWVIYSLRVTLKNSYQADLDIMNQFIILVPCFGMALIAHPSTRHNFVFRVLWAFCVYVEAVSVLPQLKMMQRSKVVEKFTAHYVFALGLSRFISCAHWVLQILEGDKYLWRALGSGVWPVMVLLSEVVQTFVLADFCYYYVKSFAEGTGIIQLPAGVV